MIGQHHTQINSGGQFALMENVQLLKSLGSWDLVAVFLALVYLFRSQLWRKSNSPRAGTAQQVIQGKSDDSRDFVRVMDDDHKNCIVFFGSQTGTAEAYATRLAKEGKARFGLDTMVANLEDYDYKSLDQLPSDKVAFFILSTYGEGEPTDNAAEFYNFITSDEPSFKEGASLTQLRYIAFGLGNKSYEHYNAVVKRVVLALDTLGASRVGDVGEGDDASGTTEEDFLTWKEDMWTALASQMNLTEVQSTYEPSYSIVEEGTLTHECSEVYTGEPNKAHLFGELRAVHGPFNSHNPYIAPIASSRELFSVREESRRCIHVDVDISGSGLAYETGDHLAIWPSNANREVDRLLQVLGLYEKRHQVVDVQTMDSISKVPFPTPTTYDTIMRYYLEICGPVSRQLLSKLVPFAPNDAVKEMIAEISIDKDRFYLETHFSNLARLLQHLGDGTTWSKIPLSLLIESLPKLQHRFYSISSSPLVQPSTVSITVAIKSELISTRESQDPFCGVASNFLLALHHARLGESRTSDFSYDVIGPRQKYGGGHVPIHLRHSSFKLPKDPLRPIIMVGPGTGVAPFRGFVQERAEMMRNGQPIGQMFLFFGCRRQDEDFLYQQEWQDYESELHKKFTLMTAFSRETTKKVYVQHKLKEAAAEVYGLLEQQAHVYVCGDASRMAKDVSHALAEIIAQGRNIGLVEAEEILKDMRAKNRYQEDVWA